jgi:hypothetical protein
MLAGIGDLDKREPFVDLMQAIADGKFSKAVSNPFFSSKILLFRTEPQ